MISPICWKVTFKERKKKKSLRTCCKSIQRKKNQFPIQQYDILLTFFIKEDVGDRSQRVIPLDDFCYPNPRTEQHKAMDKD